MTEKQKEALKYKDYSDDSGMKRYYDSVFMPFGEYLEKYYSSPELKSWDRMYSRNVEPAFDEKRQDEMIKNFGYVKKEYHNFDEQYKVYNKLKNDDRLPADVKKFIGFMAGIGFFKRYNITLDEWLSIKNWSNPYINNVEDGHTINEILNYPYGINFLKSNLPQIPFWNR